MDERRIGLIGAMPVEVAPFLERMRPRREERIGPFRFWLGEGAGVPLAVGCCGVGKVNAALGAQAMIQGFCPTAILHAGVGGGLQEGLNICDAVVAKDCVQYDVDTTALGDPLGMISTVERVDLPCDGRIAEALLDAAGESMPRGRKVMLGRIATGDRFLTSAAEKKRIVRDFGACLCDQESGAIAQACYVGGVPCGVVRAVSDASDGAHQEEFKQYSGQAASVAADVVWKFLEKFGKRFA